MLLPSGRTEKESLIDFNGINMFSGNIPWTLSFSYGHTLQKPIFKL